MAFFWGVELDAATVRRHTEAAGAAYVADQAAELERLEREPPPGAGRAGRAVLERGWRHGPAGGRRLGRSQNAGHRRGAGAARCGADGRPEAHTTDLTYFSRLADAATFTRQAYGEAYRRGTDTARVVCAVQDGADWEQRLADVLRPDAVRSLDFPHAVEHLTAAAQPSLGLGTPALMAWLDEQAHTLKHASDGARQVLAALAHLPVHVAADPGLAAAARDGAVAYFTKRLAQVQYATFQAAGYPSAVAVPRAPTSWWSSRG